MFAVRDVTKFAKTWTATQATTQQSTCRGSNTSVRQPFSLAVRTPEAMKAHSPFFSNALDHLAVADQRVEILRTYVHAVECVRAWPWTRKNETHASVSVRRLMCTRACHQGPRNNFRDAVAQ